jgi:hypothetical protein
MFNGPIVFVIGAGAGFEYRMPLGSDLASGIARDTPFYFENYSSRPSRGDPDLFAILYRKLASDPAALQRFVDAGNKLSAAISSSISIDDAIYQLSEIPEAVALGKLCIIRSILKAEGQSTLAISQRTGRLDASAGRDGWIEQMFSMAAANVKLNELKNCFKNVTFINFNYDRCLEHYLFWSLVRLGLDDHQAADIVDSLNVVRPYGTIGSVLSSRKNYMGFGSGLPPDPFPLLDRIRTYTESGLHDKAELERIVLNANRFIFLGFGFHPQNMDLLTVDQATASRDRTTLMATVLGVHSGNLEIIKSRLQRALRIGQWIDLYPMTTPGLLKDLRMKILN